MLKLSKIKTKKAIAALNMMLLILLSPALVLAADPCNNTSVKGTNKVDQAKLKSCVVQTPIVKDIQSIVNFLSIGVGVIVIAMIITGGIQYSIAGDSPEATGKAKARITNALVALVAYLFIFAFLQWIIPGGLFG